MADPGAGAGAGEPTSTGTDNIKQLRGQVEEVQGIMQDNINKVIANSENLNTLSLKTDQLASDATVFKNTSKALKRKMMWRNIKLRLIMVAVVLVILAYLLLPTIIAASKDADAEPTTRVFHANGRRAAAGFMDRWV